MARYFEITVTVDNFDYNKTEDILDAIFNNLGIQDSENTPDISEFTPSNIYLTGEINEETHLNVKKRLNKTVKDIILANGEPCFISFKVVDLENIPFELYEYPEDFPFALTENNP